MFKKKVVIILYVSKTPCRLTISTNQGEILKSKIIESNNEKICICTKSCEITISAEYGTETIYEMFYLSNKRCQNIFSNIVFSPSRSKKITNIFTLSDATYGFPISNAILTFKQN